MSSQLLKSLSLALLVVLCLASLNAALVSAATPIPGEPVNCPRNPQPVETLCNGIDDSCTGRIDELDPVEENKCSTGLKGACAFGYYQCHPVTGAKVCNGPKPTPEALDGIDNDCDGIVDNVPTVTQAVVSRVALFRATGISPVSTNTYEMALDQRGISYDVIIGNSNIDAVLATLRSSYSLVLIPGGVASSFFTDARVSALEQFVRSGGVVFYFLPDGGAASNAFAGLTSVTARPDISYIRFENNAQAPIMKDLDTVEELNLYVNGFTSGAGAITRYLQVMTQAASTTLLASAYSGDTGLTKRGAAITRRVLGSGSIYTFGHDMYWYISYRCYINCFEPSVDTLGLMLRDGMTEGAKGHSVFKHTVPSAQETILFMTTDTHDYSDTVTGMTNTVTQVTPRPRISFFSVTHTDQLNPQVLSDMCKLGQCPIGGHTVSHPEGFNAIPLGTGTESIATGYKGTLDDSAAGTNLNGELRVNKEIVYRATGSQLRAFRSPWLELHNAQFPLLEELGFVVSSSLAIGDLKSNLPVDLRKYELLQGIFKYANLKEFPLSGEDGVVDANKVRYDLQPKNYKYFLGRWKYIQMQNKRNNAMTVILDHDGWGAGPRNEQIIAAKKQAMIDSFNFAKANDAMYTMSVEQFTDWWNGRNNIDIDASFSTATGYRGTLTSGSIATANFVLQFGDKITKFVCSACGSFTISGKRVIISNFKANLVATFSASIDGTTPTNPPPQPTSTPAPEPTQPASCSSLVINSFVSGSLTSNDIGLPMGDDATMASTSIDAGRLTLNSKSGAYWYTLLSAGAGSCFDASSYSAVSINIRAPAGTQVTLQIQTKDSACNARSTAYNVQLASYAASSGGFSTTTSRIITVPFSDFGGLPLTKLNAISILSVSPATASVSIDDLVFVSWACAQPSSTATPPPPTCTPLLVDDFSDGLVGTNSFGLLASDDNTMTAKSVVGGRLSLTPKTGAYFYSLVANDGQCLSLSTFSGISFSVNAASGARFTVEIQQRDITCNGFQSVSSTTVTGTGSTQVVTLPFSAFAGLDRTKVFAIAFSGFSTTAAVTFDDIKFVC